MNFEFMTIDTPLPAFGSRKPAIRRRVVVLPQPEEPSSVTNSLSWSFAAAGGTEQRHELLVMDIQIQPIQNALSIKFHYDIPQ